jgi:hypothetical protein
MEGLDEEIANRPSDSDGHELHNIFLGLGIIAFIPISLNEFVIFSRKNSEKMYCQWEEVLRDDITQAFLGFGIM